MRTGLASDGFITSFPDVRLVQRREWAACVSVAPKILEGKMNETVKAIGAAYAYLAEQLIRRGVSEVEAMERIEILWLETYLAAETISGKRVN